MNPAPSLLRFEYIAESLVIFLFGALLMHFFYAGTGGVAGNELGLPGNDSFYHVKMSAMMSEGEIPKEFPWLKYAYFTKEGHGFVSHHFGFHLLMAPFVKLSHYLNQDYAAGGRWATSVFFGLLLMVFNLLLISEDVRWRWMWLLFFLLMPIQFFTRQAFVRAITPSLLIMLLILLFMFRRRYVLAGISVYAATTLYLGGVMFAPVIVALYALAMVFGPRDSREFPWLMVLLTLSGWLLGVYFYPYNDGMVDFLKLQVFGTGLTPDIPVGQEWQPYQDLWWFTQMIGPTAAVWAVAVAFRSRLGPTLSAKELSLILMNFVFLLLMAKARRFVEYWPVFALLSAAYLVAPQLRQASDRFRWLTYGRAGWPLALFPITLAILPFAAAFVIHHHGSQFAFVDQTLDALKKFLVDLGPLLVEWKVWACVAVLYLLIVLVGPFGFQRTSRDTGSSILPFTLTPLILAAIVGGVYGTVYLLANFAGKNWSQGKIPFHWTTWVVLGAICFVVISISRGTTQAVATMQPTRGVVRAILAMFLTFFFLIVATATAGRQLVDIQESTRCRYDLVAIRNMMAFLKERSQPGDLIFTDDWDIFPVYFYHNSYNHYIVGLDPKFTHERRPDLWQRYVKVSRGEVPSTTSYTVRDKNGKERKEQIQCKLEDIRDEFGCKYVITDRDHKSLAGKLAAAKDLAELIFPVADYQEAQKKSYEYLLFRIRENGEAPGEASIPEPDDQGILYLSLLTPVSVSQDYGDLTMDRSVEGGKLQPGPDQYERGLGSHAPSKLVYDIPEGYDYFEATVGVNRSTNGAGSIKVSVSLDDNEPVFISPVLTGTSDPSTVHVELGKARRITLLADPTSDGKRFDHVDWAGACFVKAKP